MEFKASDARFKFGSDHVYESRGQVIFPAILGKRKVFISADVVDTKVPLLLSKATMKKAKTIIDFESDCVTMFGNKVKLLHTTRGHYCISLNRKIDISHGCCENERVYFTNIKKIKNLSSIEKGKVALKVHKQFCHCPGNKLKKLFVDAGVKDKEMLILLEEVKSKCKLCEKYGATPPKPIVTLPYAKEFNQHIAMDLKDINSEHILHLIDHMSRFSAACVIKSKKKEVVIEAILKIWISTFGSPNKILSDNGGEFSNDEFREMGEKLNTRITTTAAESPWSNGINERHNGLLGEMVMKTMEDTGCTLDVALSWAVCAKNSLANVNGYSPHQLVFGRNPNTPSILHDKLPALEEKCYSKIMNINLNAMHSARRNFIKAESSEKLRRALRAKTRNHTGMIFHMGQSVYYKREKCGNIWKGPGKVIGVDGEVIMIRHGGQGVRVHSSMVKLENSEFDVCKTSKSNIDDHNNEQMETRVLSEHFERELDTNATSGRENTVITNSIDDISSNYTNNDNHTEVGNNDITSVNKNNDGPTQEYITVDESEVVNNDISSVSKNNDHRTQEHITVDESPVIEVNAGGQKGQSSSGKLPVSKSNVFVKPIGSDDWKTWTIIGRGGKASGKYKRHLNIIDDTNQKKWINWDESAEEWIQGPNVDIPVEEVLISEVHNWNANEVLESKFTEIQKWRNYEAFDEVVDEGQKSISTRWVITEKEGKIKSRLCARGFEDNELKERVDSPTCSKMNLRLLIAIAATKQWKINSLDFQSAFLQGEDVKGDIYIKPPKEADTNKLWKLRKHVYGLKQSSRKWYNKVSNELESLGLSKSKLDEALFFWHCKNELKGIVAGHVDDFFWSGTSNLQTSVVDQLIKTFQISSESHDKFKFLGLDVRRDGLVIEIDQSIYAEGIQYVMCHDMKNRHRFLNDEEKASLRSAIGQLCWISNQTRPDIAYDVCQLSVRYKNAQVLDIINANKTIKKVRNNNLCLKYPVLVDGDKYILKVYSDASFNNLPNGGSQGGYIIFLCDSEDNAAPIQWQSKRIRRVVKSTLAAECLALEDAVDTAYYLKSLLLEMLRIPPENIEIQCFIDNNSLYENIHSTTNVKEEKRLILDISIIKEMLERKELTSVSFVKSKYQLADCFTKQGASSLRLCEVISAGSLVDYQK